MILIADFYDSYSKYIISQIFKSQSWWFYDKLISNDNNLPVNHAMRNKKLKSSR